MDTSGEIAVVGGSEADRAALTTSLHAAGLAARGTAALALDGPETVPPLLIVTGPDVVALVSAARDVPVLAHVGILAVVPSVPPTAATDALAAGASDIVAPNAGTAVLAARVRSLLRSNRGGDGWGAGSLAPELLRIQELLSEGGDDPEALVGVLEICAHALGFPRASLVAYVDGSEHAIVIAATDDPTRSQFVLKIAEYPEVAAAIRDNAPVLLDDAQSDPITAAVAAKLVIREVRGIAVLPVAWRRRAIGAILLRKSTTGASHLVGRGTEFGRLAAGLLGGHLRHGRVFESLRERTHRLSRVSYEAERRLRGIESLKEHFDSAADGVVILDAGGRILFVNPAAERITGFGKDGLLGQALGDLVVTSHQSLIADAVARVLGQTNVEPFDLELATTSGASACVSVSTSTVLADTGAVILTFRDVTAERALETELRSTKEFLERLIDSTVDAIIAADMRGTIILFNQGAERLFGYRADEIVGKTRVWELYPEGVSRQVMRMLRSTSYGGVGRLEQTRREIRTRNGEVVPVTMTASVVYEGDQEVATVGILSDLRERIRIEQRLLQAQEKLQLTEKQALVAELAGAAAHELNQPLTSIIGYSQLIQRQSPADAPHLRAVGVILSEAERMAGIVKKIGRITKYETTEYVGSASIIDLDRSTTPSDPGLVIPASDVRHEESVDDEGLTREFTAVVPGRALADVLGELGDLLDDPALDRPAFVKAAAERRSPLVPSLRPATTPPPTGEPAAEPAPPAGEPAPGAKGTP
ncbi:MAG: PAS domain S-box protein [Deltaproteobacteria bacterium]|nr:PAS domain S-box protein [Deltaproteobacteria bacterium]